MRPGQIKYEFQDKNPEFQDTLYMSLEGEGEEVDPKKYKEGLREFDKNFWGK